MAPEALAGTFDHRSDLYSLGCVLYEMVTGCRPFTGTSWHVVNQHLNEQPAPLRTLRPDTPVELERLVSQLLAKDPAQCPDSADGVCELLEEINDRHFGDAPPSRGSDITSEVVISHAEAAEGAVIPLRFTTHRSCPACATREDEQAARACPTCRGKDGLSTSSTPARSASPPASGTSSRSGSASSAVLGSMVAHRGTFTSPCMSRTGLPPGIQPGPMALCHSSAIRLQHHCGPATQKAAGSALLTLCGDGRLWGRSEGC